jgi:hypothetical protein
MKKQRQKQIGIDAVIKVQNFLKDAQTEIFEGNNFSLAGLATDYRIDRMISTLAVRNGYFEKGVVKGEYSIGPNFDSSATGAKKLIEMVRLSKIDRSFAKTSAEITANKAAESKNINPDEGDYIPKIDLTKTKSFEAIKKWISGAEPQRTLFTENEKEFEHKLQIASAIAGGVFSRDKFNSLKEIQESSDFYVSFIVDITEELYSKLKK